MAYHKKTKIFLLLLLTLLLLVVMILLPKMAQSPDYHLFADHRTLAGIANFLNTISNLPFLVVGLAGILLMIKNGSQLQPAYLMLFIGILLTGLGSAYYHLNPSNNRLVYDRIPMTIVFMALLSATLSELIDYKMGIRLLFILLPAGIASVLYWKYTESIGNGDLRAYGFVQFYPILLIPIITLLFPASHTKKTIPVFYSIILWYILAKFLEYYDGAIQTFTHFISGHTLKHLAAAMACYYILRLYQVKYDKQASAQH